MQSHLNPVVQETGVHYFKICRSRVLRQRDLAVRVALRPRVRPEGAVRVADDDVEPGQVARGRGLVHYQGVERPTKVR